ncbi:HEL225Wp [Eremothecium sinecaudum]|uniref:HEL225Wp n=1 Tax=Eremothecium sinecaudum TaxID=45286 RepID=A0A0X8HSJ1_9SACH|nr:HEL225Wp [Eremothecium sinecaudum]AMD21056.1 HEL225Wp [Eremothecium sinecaudum]
MIKTNDDYIENSENYTYMSHFIDDSSININECTQGTQLTNDLLKHSIHMESMRGSELDNKYNTGAGKGKKRLACKNCRRRRKKCDLLYPCSSCLRLKLECNVNEEDLRKKRYSNSYVKTLESHIAYLEHKVKQMSDKMTSEASYNMNDEYRRPDDRELIDVGLTSRKNGDEFGAVGSAQTGVDTKKSLFGSVPFIDGNKDDPSSPDVAMSLPSGGTPDDHEDPKLKQFANSGIYPGGPVCYKPRLKDGNENEEKAQRINEMKAAILKRSREENTGPPLNSNPTILKCLYNFYTWLYPGQFIFVHRASFLYGFFNNSEGNYENSQYCPEELIYAMVAIGSRLMPDQQKESEAYYKLAKDKMLGIVFDEEQVATKIITVQALLFLAFYELGKGNNQQAWYLSDLAIRVGDDLGFELDPKV